MPYVGEDDRPLRGDGVREPADARVHAHGFGDRRQNLVEWARVDVDHRKVVASHDRHHHHGDQENGDVDTPPPELLVGQHCEKKTEEQLEHDRRSREVESPPVVRTRT